MYMLLLCSMAQIKEKQLNIGEARANLSELVQRAANGEEIIISKAGVPRAKLVPVEPLKKRAAGSLAHLFTRRALDNLVEDVMDGVDKEENWDEFYTDLELP